MSKEQKQSGVTSPEPVVASKAEEQKPAVDMKTAVAEAVREALSQAIPMAIVASQQVAGQAQVAAIKQRQGDYGDKCQECGQFVRGCKGEHDEVIVYPSSQRHARFFQGIRINGVLYLSPNAGTRVKVPKGSAVLYMLAQWEANEDALMHGRVSEHNSGSIGSSGSNFNPAHSAWR